MIPDTAKKGQKREITVDRSVNNRDTYLANGGKSSGLAVQHGMIPGSHHCLECHKLQIEGKDARIHMPSMMRVCSHKLVPGREIEGYSMVTEAVAHGLRLIGEGGL